jgi:hypothetical protein
MRRETNADLYGLMSIRRNDLSAAGRRPGTRLVEPLPGARAAVLVTTNQGSVSNVGTHTEATREDSYR